MAAAASAAAKRVFGGAYFLDAVTHMGGWLGQAPARRRGEFLTSDS